MGSEPSLEGRRGRKKEVREGRRKEDVPSVWTPVETTVLKGGRMEEEPEEEPPDSTSQE
jgi:hypothetical protein